MKTSAVLVALYLLVTTTVASAAGGFNYRRIEFVAFQTGGFFLYAAGGWDNPNSCTRSDAIVLQESDPNYDKAYALLLAASYIAGHQVKGYSDGCATFDGQTYNTVRGFKYLTVQP